MVASVNTKNVINRLVRALVAVAATWGTVALIHLTPATNRSIASMTLLLEILGISTLGDRMLAIAASISGALAFSWYYVDQVNSFAITTTQGALTFSMLIVTALTGSHLAIRAQARAAEAIRRREEMERLHQLGSALLVSGSTPEAAQDIVDNLVLLFGVIAAELTIQGQPAPFVAGEISGKAHTVIKPADGRYGLALYGSSPSAEVRIALKNLIDLVLDRAKSATQRARLEATERGEEFRRTVLNSLAHNFKTPLTSIKAAASVLRGKRELPPADARELATVIDEEADRLDLMIRESLDLARIESHQASPRLEACSVGAIIEAVASRVARFLGGRQLQVRIPNDLPTVFGDSFLLEQMVIQVLDNAWKYSRPGARISITAGRVVGGVVLEVANEGYQIPVEERERIFAKFYRGLQTSSHVEGTGMGLPIARSIAEAHAGRLTLENLGDGPTFRFILPVGVSVEKSGPDGAGADIERQDDREPQHFNR